MGKLVRERLLSSNAQKECWPRSDLLEVLAAITPDHGVDHDAYLALLAPVEAELTQLGETPEPRKVVLLIRPADCPTAATGSPA